MTTDRFTMNGYSWKVRFVPHDSPMLVDRTGVLTVATTNPETRTIYLSDKLTGNFMVTVFLHELGHCALYCFGLLDDIHRMVLPKYWIEMEEFICNFLADFGYRVFQIAYQTFGYDAWKLIPSEFERYLSA